jgi:hypothetical protein
MQSRGFTDDEIIETVVKKNATFNPPLTVPELNTVIKQIFKYRKGVDPVIRCRKKAQAEGKFISAYWDTKQGKLMLTSPQHLYDVLKSQRQTVLDAFNREKALQRIADDITTFGDDEDDDVIDFTSSKGVSR